MSSDSTAPSPPVNAAPANRPEARERYDHARADKRWQQYWQAQRCFVASRRPGRRKRYVLDMFPYPSGAGLHVGHPEGYTATDIMSRFWRMRGDDVLHPMGWDAFGLPAEQYAIETGTHPRETTAKNIATFKRQLKSLGFSYDWDREIDTTNPEYVRWTQWIFLQLFKRGLAYQDEVMVNWCPALGTVLANEEVVDGKSERGQHPVVRRALRQWMLKITAYADRLAGELEGLDWPHGTMVMQKEWIGRSEGARVMFKLNGQDDGFEVYTTRPDTLFGATYCVLAPEHPLVARVTSAAQREAVERYVTATSGRAERARMAGAKDKTGVFTGGYAVNPVTNEPVPIWVADYVLMSYGTGAIMAVPAHDARDYAFARKFELPIVEVVKGGDIKQAAFCEHEAGELINSGFLNGLQPPAAKKKVTAWLETHGLGKAEVQYKLRDWVFSRQRYWGEPIPIYFPVRLDDDKGDPRAGDGYTIDYDQPIAVDEQELPLQLPELTNFEPGDEPAGALARATEWRFFKRAGKWFARETNTMPQWAGSCWYYLRYTDAHNDKQAWSPQADADWMPVDLYVGGAEHAVLHLLYARFWHKVMFDEGLVKDREPFQKLVHQGMILGEIEHTLYQKHDGSAVSRQAVRIGENGPVTKAGDEPLTVVRVADDKVMKKGSRFVLVAAPDIEVDSRAHKMSKSRGNVVNPDDIVKQYGADVLRMYEMFMGPLEAVKPWQASQIPGVVRFRDRVFAVCTRQLGDTLPAALARSLHKTIKKVTEDIEAMRFNTALSALMELTNELTALEEVPHEAATTLVTLLSPFAPHLCEELNERMGNAACLATAAWPTFDAAKCEDETWKMGVQVNGKKRGTVTLPRGASRQQAQHAAAALTNVAAYLKGKEVKKFIFVPGRIINFVVR